MLQSSFQKYVDSAIKHLFSETDAVIEKKSEKLKRQIPLHAGDICALKDIYAEEWFDAKTLRPFICDNAHKFSGGISHKFEKIGHSLSTIDAMMARQSERVTEILSHTSAGMVFYSSVMAYVERYEMEYGFSRRPWLNSELLFRLIGEEFEHAKNVHATLSDHISERLCDIQWRIVQEAGTSGIGSEKATELIIQRGVLAEDLRKGADTLFETMSSDFEQLKIRLLRHNVRISYHWER